MPLPHFVSLSKLLKLYLIITALFFSNVISAQQLIFSEVMFIPSESNSEFIEIYNNSDKSLNLSAHRIKYHTASSDEIISLSNEYDLLPYNYAVIFEADYDFNIGLYKDIIPDDALIFILDDNAFGSTGMANKSDRTVYLISETEDTLDVFTYSANNEIGYSEERIDYNQNTWENSRLLNGTPGKKNSIAAVQYDLSITEFNASSPYVIVGDSVYLNIKIKNLGVEAAENFNLKIYFDQNNDNKLQLNELLFNEVYLELASQNSLFISYSVINLIEGENNFIAEIDYSLDEFIGNNSSSLTIKGIEINEERGDIVINEIMYAPKSPEPEWIELYNKSEKIINLKNYQVADNSDSITIIDTDIFLDPQEYLVIADDSSISNIYQNIEELIITKLPTLNNSGDDVLLLDSLNRIIDSLTYTSVQGGKNGKSLERIDPFDLSENNNNWSESIDPTPGSINSITQKDYDLAISQITTNPEYPLIGTSAKFVAKIINIGKKQIDFSIEVFNDTNQDSIADKFLGTSDQINLNNGDSVQFEFSYEVIVSSTESSYIFKLNTNDDDSTNNIFIFTLSPTYPKSSIVINEIMYSPINFEPEWIELYNNSEYDINIYNWLIGDVLTNPVFKSIPNEFIFPQKSYLVISKSHSIYNFHRSINSPVIELSFANLNNDKDGVVIKDNKNRTIDSLKYFNDWGGTGGKSIERINIDHSSTNNNNWSSSIDLEGSTPGRINSAAPKDYDLSVTSLYTNPKFPIEGESVNLITKINNYGNYDADNFKVEFFTNDKNQVNMIESLDHLSLSAGDSVILESVKSFTVLDTSSISVNITFRLDQDDVNNYAEGIIIPGFNKNTVLINEIMFKPNTGEPEWIEIINNSDTVISISNWLIGDLSTHSIITTEEVLITPQEYLVISDYHTHQKFDSEIKVVQTDLPKLSDTKDAIIIYDFRNAVIDSTYYNVKNNFSSSTSLERIDLKLPSYDFTNWTFSMDQTKSTPGKVNSISLLPDYSFDDVIITEIMFDPSDSNSEFLELYNSSDKQIEIGGWKIEDENRDYFNLIEESFLLNPNEYFIVASDSSILENYNWLENNTNISILNLSSLSLTNSGKLFYLKDIKRNIIDSIHYTNSWHNSALLETKNISLELINSSLNRNKSSNWSSSVSGLGATPGLENSINVENLASEAKLEITPNPFSPDNDGFEDFTFINYNLTQPISQIRIRIFDSKGRLVRSLVNNHVVGSVGSVVFDGLDENKRTLKIGIYIILFEAVNTNNAVVEVIKDVVVVARKL